ncbi:hypothetical protein AGMMS49983_03310 [Clostridia bacterium]|nr:hypothetical protein AGMMS49983_03310 [Clostridia bacterium]
MALANKIDIDKEIARRKVTRESVQAKVDLEELDRRVDEYEAGRSTLLSSDEVWDMVAKFDYK